MKMRYAYFNPHDGRVLQWIDTEAMNYNLPDESMLHECSDAEWNDRHNGEKMVKEGSIVDYVAPAIDPQPVVLQCNPYQFHEALHIMNLTDAVNAAAAQDRSIQNALQFAPAFRRDHPKVDEIATAIGKTDADIDALFELAVTLTP